MTDVYATIAEAEPSIVRRLADVLEIRGAEAQQQAMLRDYLAELPFPAQARVLEVGCGTGVVARVLARWPGVAQVEGIDPSPVFLERARQLAEGIDNLAFRQADGRNLPFEPGTFDVVVVHTVLSHVPGPEQLLAEAWRVLRPGGWLAAFDGDYATATVAISQHDPLQACVEQTIATLVQDPWLVRRLPALARGAGFEVRGFRSHGYLQTTEPTYMLTLVERGADFLVAAGHLGPEAGAALKAEACRRVETGRFFGHIAYASLLGGKPEASRGA
jgi:ubiquinone/menaquinone biosynthesis C-methylase UbiE